MSAPLLAIQDLTVRYRLPEGLVASVEGVSLDLGQGEALALVGESGCGKSSLAAAILRTGAPNVSVDPASRIFFEGVDVLTLAPEQLRLFRWAKAAMVFQAAQNAFNPTLRLREQFLDTLQDHGSSRGRGADLERVAELLALVKLEAGRVLPSYPHQLSGGMRQRALIALALVLDPELLILDEPTTALDAITQHHVLEILGEVQERRGLALLLVTHDLAAAARLCRRVGVMYAGRLVETGRAEDVFADARHPYAQALVQAVPTLRGDVTRHRPIPGAMPDAGSRRVGCPFHPRCPHAFERCRTERPELREVAPGRAVACFLEAPHAAA